MNPMQRKRTHYVTCVIVLTVAACGSFWIMPPPWNRSILGLYSPKWFLGSIVANIGLIAFAAYLLRRTHAAAECHTVPDSPLPDRNNLTTGKKMLFSAVLLLPLLGATEWGLRAYYFPPAPRLSRPDAGTFDRFHATLQHVDRIEQDGGMQRAFRGRTFPRQSTRRFRIVCLGGSTTWGHHLSAEETWPYMLEQFLNEAGYDAEVINAGRHWYTSVHSLSNYVSFMRYLKPDIVVVMHGVNDLARNFPDRGEPDVEWDYGGYQGPMRNVLSAYRESLHDSSVTFTHPVLWLDNLAIVRLVKEWPIRWAARKKAEHATVRAEQIATIDSLQAHLRYLASLIAADDTTVVLSTQAHIYGPAYDESQYNFPSTMRETYMITKEGKALSPESVREAMSAVRTRILALGSAEGLPVADVEHAVGYDVECFMDDFHLNEEGNRRAARELFSTLSEIMDYKSEQAEEQTVLDDRSTRRLVP